MGFPPNRKNLVNRNTFKVIKIGKEKDLIEEVEGFKKFDKQGSAFFCELENLNDNNSQILEIKGKKEKYSLLIYSDVGIKFSTVSLKGLSKYVIEHYHNSKREDFDPTPIGENIGDILSEIFNDLKRKIYLYENIYFKNRPLASAGANTQVRPYIKFLYSHH